MIFGMWRVGMCRVEDERCLYLKICIFSIRRGNLGRADELVQGNDAHEEAQKLLSNKAYTPFEVFGSLWKDNVIRVSFCVFHGKYQ